MADLEYVRAYINDLLVFSLGLIISINWNRFYSLKSPGLKVNAKKSFFGRRELEYFGYWITREGIQPMPKRVQAILAIQPPKDKRQLRRFIGMINFYRDMWIQRSEILAPLTELTSETAKWQWSERQEKTFKQKRRCWVKKYFWHILILTRNSKSTQMPATPS